MSERVAIEVGEDGVAEVRLTRPDKHNALDQGMFEGIAGAIDQVGGDPAVKAVVLHGEGPSFCSGLDVPAWMGRDDAFEQLVGTRDPDTGVVLAQKVATGWLDEVPVPVIAALHGNVLGGGCQIALGADIRIVAPDVKMSIFEVKWGLIPDMGITRTLPRLTGADRAKELTFTGRKVGGEEAVRLGIATRVADDPVAEAFALAREIAAARPEAVRYAKRLYEEAWTGVDPRPGLELETELQVELLEGMLALARQAAATKA